MSSELQTLSGVELRVKVLDLDGRALEGAKVTLLGAGATVTVAWDEVLRCYRATGLQQGKYGLVVQPPPGAGLAAQKRGLELRGPGSEELFVLGNDDLPAFYRAGVRTPFRPLPDLVAVQVDRQVAGIDREDLRRLFADLGLTETEVAPAVGAAGVLALRTPTSDRSDVDAIVRKLQDSRGVSRAGAVVLLGKETLSFLSGQVSVSFRSAVTVEQARAFGSEYGLELQRKLLYAENVWVFKDVERAPTYQLLERLEALAEHPDLEWAEPEFVTPPPSDAVHPSDWLWPSQWDHQRAGCHDAWQALQDAQLERFGDPALILAVVDEGIASKNGVPVHPEFDGVVSSGQPKVAMLYDFGLLVPHNDDPLGDHGLASAGVAAAAAENPAPTGSRAFGIAGAAPNVRVMGLIYPLADLEVTDMYVWAAGLDAGSPHPAFPPPLSEGAAVLTASVGFGCGSSAPGVALKMIDTLSKQGRGGKGCLCFFSAGNGNDDFTISRPFAACPGAFAVTACTLADDGVSEVKAGYSSFGPRTFLCAPSSDGSPGGVDRHNPPSRFASLGAALSTDAQVISYPDFEAGLQTRAVAGDWQLVLTSIAGLAAGDCLMIGNPGAPGQEPARIDSVDPTRSTISLERGLMSDHDVDTPVYRGPAWHRWFGGTSSATPLCAGVAALALSANPALTWQELRDILQTTAEKIDPHNSDSVGQWLDGNGQPAASTQQACVFSQWYGYGRVNAAAAVAAALRSRAPTGDPQTSAPTIPPAPTSTSSVAARAVAPPNVGVKGLAPSRSRGKDRARTR